MARPLYSAQEFYAIFRGFTSDSSFGANSYGKRAKIGVLTVKFRTLAAGGPTYKTGQTPLPGYVGYALVSDT